MKKLLYLFILLIPTVVFGQQFPFMEGFYVNPFSLSPAYTGIHNCKTIFMDYRSDWSGIEGGPATCQLGYNDKIKNKAGQGGEIVDGILLNFTYCPGSNAGLITSGSHKVSPGVRLYPTGKDKKEIQF